MWSSPMRAKSSLFVFLVIRNFPDRNFEHFEISNSRHRTQGDVRLPNFVDLGLFSKACFLHNGKAQLQVVA